jgi:PPM family protein phosphatase
MKLDMTWTTGEALSIGGRREQQDRVAVHSSDDGQRHLLALADGMGGHRGGARAAQVVIDTAANNFNNQAVDDPKGFLQILCDAAHNGIRALGENEMLSPGSTCAFLYLNGAEAYWAHVGDSRLYHFRGRRLLKRTADHSVLQLMLAQGEIKENSAEARALQNQLYQRLGGIDPPEPDFGSTHVEPDDLFVLCSDGFWQTVKAEQIIAGVEESGASKDGAERLVRLALRQSNKECDNISVALAQWKAQSTGSKGVFSALRKFLISR